MPARAIFRAVIVVLGCITSSWAGEAWKFTDIRGKQHDPFAGQKNKAMVVVFVTTDCPIANYYQPTLSRLAETYSKKRVPFYLVHADPDTELAQARKHAEQYKTKPAVIVDPDQKIARRLKAKVTPEAFVVDRKGQTVYRGRINDLYPALGKRRFEPRSHDLRDALDAFLAGDKIKQPATKAIGCYISYKK